MTAKNKPTVVLVHSKAPYRDEVKVRLAALYDIVDFPAITEALNYARKNLPDAILIAEARSNANDFNYLTHLRHEVAFKTIPVIVVLAVSNGPLLASAIRSGATAVLAQPYLQSTLTSLISGLINDQVEVRWNSLPALQADSLLKTVAIFTHVSETVAAGKPIAYNEVKVACLPLVAAVNSGNFNGILRGVRGHDNYTYAHSLRVATLLSLFGGNIGLSTDDQSMLATGGLLHDLGKLQIPIRILNKSGRLTKEEFLAMQRHVPATLSLLENCPDLPKGVFIMAGQHPERLDGTGYPNGLKGNQLNQLARMISIVDVFTALTDRRVYKQPMLPEKALAIMSSEMTAHLDMQLLAFFRHMLLDAAVE